jgi:hypothetical protein
VPALPRDVEAPDDIPGFEELNDGFVLGVRGGVEHQRAQRLLERRDEEEDETDDEEEAPGRGRRRMKRKRRKTGRTNAFGTIALRNSARH